MLMMGPFGRAPTNDEDKFLLAAEERLWQDVSKVPEGMTADKVGDDTDAKGRLANAHEGALLWQFFDAMCDVHAVRESEVRFLVNDTRRFTQLSRQEKKRLV